MFLTAFVTSMFSMDGWSKDTRTHESFLYAAQLDGTDFMFTGDEPQLIFRDGVTNELYAINDPSGDIVFLTDGSTNYHQSLFNKATLPDTYNAINLSI